MTQIKIAKKAQITQGHLSKILNGKRSPSWKLAKKLAEVTGTDPVLWLEGSSQERRAALGSKANKHENAAVVNY